MAAKKRLGDFFAKRNEEGKTGLPIWSVTINNGLVARDTLERKMDTNLSASDHLLIRKGDIAYNMMRMWQGASGLASQDGLVSPAYVVLAPKDNIDPLFAAYWFKSPRMIYLFWAYSYGITKDRLRLYYKDFARIPVTPPPLEKQKRIAALLLSWDEAIEKISAQIDLKQKLKRGLMQQLLTGKRRFPEFDGEPSVRSLKIADIAEVIVSNVDKKTVDGERPVLLCNYTDVYYNNEITSRISFMTATASLAEIEKFSILKGDVIVTKDSESPDDIAAPALVAEDLPGVLCGYHLAIIRCDTDQLWPAFLNHLLKDHRVRHYFFTLANGVTRFGLSKGSLCNAHLPMPLLQEQKKIAGMLDAMDENIALLIQQRETLREQRNGLIQQLLTGKAYVPVKSKEVAHA